MEISKIDNMALRLGRGLRNMVETAHLHEDALKLAWRRVWYEERYKYLVLAGWTSDVELPRDNYNAHHFVSVDMYHNLLGHVCYQIDRTTDTVSGLSVVSFCNEKSEDSIQFGVDLYRILKDIETKYHFKRLLFSVVEGNPAKTHYDRIIKRLKAREVGVYYNDVKSWDGVLRNKIVYEVLLNQE